MLERKAGSIAWTETGVTAPTGMDNSVCPMLLGFFSLLDCPLCNRPALSLPPLPGFWLDKRKRVKPWLF